MIVTGMIAWIFCWIYEFSRKDRRGLLDLVGDTIQVEEETAGPGLSSESSAAAPGYSCSMAGFQCCAAVFVKAIAVTAT